jgi:hypothetical protein
MPRIWLRRRIEIDQCSAPFASAPWSRGEQETTSEENIMILPLWISNEEIESVIRLLYVPDPDANVVAVRERMISLQVMQEREGLQRQAEAMHAAWDATCARSPTWNGGIDTRPHEERPADEAGFFMTSATKPVAE